MTDSSVSVETGPLGFALATGTTDARSDDDAADVASAPEPLETSASGDASDRPGINRWPT